MPYTRGERLRQLRKARGVDQTEAAAGIGISRPYLSLLERDQKGTHMDHMRSTLERAARYYGVPAAYLLAETVTEYIAAFVESVPEAPPSFCERLRLVVDALERFDPAYTPAWLAEQLGTEEGVVEAYLSGHLEVTDSVGHQICAVTGAPPDWLAPRPSAEPHPDFAVQRIVESAIRSGIAPEELDMLIQAWLAVQRTRKPSV